MHAEANPIQGNRRDARRWPIPSPCSQHSAVQPHQVHIFQLRQRGSRTDVTDPGDTDTMVYLHSKTYIVDDEFMILGSIGMERAGATNDIEVRGWFSGPLLWGFAFARRAGRCGSLVAWVPGQPHPAGGKRKAGYR